MEQETARMGIIFMSLISVKVIAWQIFLGGVQVAGLMIGGKKGLLIAYLIVFFWTLSKTYNDLLVLQLLLQSAIGFFLFSSTRE